MDSKSALQALLSKWDHPSIAIIMKYLVFIHTVHKSVVFCWVPSHTGISGNEKADHAAKEALQKPIFECQLSFTDARHYIGNYVHDLWQNEWNMAGNNKLHAIRPIIGNQPSATRSVRKDEVVLCRLRIGHTRLTHSHLMKQEPPPECVTCQCRLTIQHILVDCIEYDFFRTDLFKDNVTLYSIFKNVSPDTIILFVKRAFFYNAI